MSGAATARATLRGHLAILRVDHWFKNAFVLPGVVVAATVATPSLGVLVPRLLVGLLAVGLVASSNYTLNELLDREYDREHPTKHARPAASGQVSFPLAIAQWLVVGAVGIGLGAWLSTGAAASLAALWAMGCVYNIPPVRTKEVAYLDVLSESVNNPLRLLLGWYVVDPDAIAPASLLLSYWMIGAFFMALKRFAEYRQIGDPARAARYRRSFAHYDEPRLLVSVMAYASASMLFLGAFTMRYRVELVLSFPFVALFMATYLRLAFQPGSAVQEPERLWREPSIVGMALACAIVMGALLAVDLPWLHGMLAPTMTVAR